MGALDEVRHDMTRAVTLFRLGQEGAGSDALAQVTDGLLNGLTSGALQASPAALNAVLPEVIAAQERADYIWIADLLEYELLPILKENAG